LNFLIRYLQTALEHQKWKYLEIRPVNGNFDEPDSGIAFRPTATYFLHTVDLRPELGNVFRTLHKDSVQRRIQRAERASLIEKCGRSDDLLKDFYRLFVATRSRHHVPPIPFAWFRNLTRSQDMDLEIRLAYQDRIPIAGILTLRFRDVVYYKYGGSDPQFNKFGAIPWLLWRAIAAGKSTGAVEMDLGRTEEDNAGLLAFKNHWVPCCKSLVYWNFPGTPTLDSAHGWKLKMAKRIFSYMPDILLSVTGRLLYRHIG